MIGYIKGKVTDITDNAIVLEKDGIGFFIYTSQLVIANLSMNQETVTIYTHMHVREDEISLFGFLSKEELEMFRMLLTVNGVGPKAALSILSVLSVPDLICAIVSGDTSSIKKANGIGAKGAGRIIMELKDKVSLDTVGDTLQNDTANISVSDGAVMNAVLALTSLGYSESESRNAIGKVAGYETMTTEELLKHALRNI